MGDTLGEIDEDGVVIDESRIGLFGLISNECKQRMSIDQFKNITSKIYIGLMGCKFDDVPIPFSEKRIHKEKVGIIIVALDFTSILVMIFFFSKINELNNEFLTKIDDLRV